MGKIASKIRKTWTKYYMQSMEYTQNILIKNLHAFTVYFSKNALNLREGVSFQSLSLHIFILCLLDYQQILF